MTAGQLRRKQKMMNSKLRSHLIHFSG